MDAKMEQLQDSVSDDYSKLSLRGVALAGTLSANIHAWAQGRGVSEREIAANPESLEALLSEQTGSLLAALDNNACSGVFLILDATVNPASENAADSRAGIFFKRTEPNNITVSSKIHCLRGPASVARANGIELMGQWEMEFDVSEAPFYEKTLNAARENGGADLSRLYYWSERYLMNGNSEHVMLLCVPLVARDGTVYGLCGMEVSAMLFKRMYTPNNARFPRVFSALAPAVGDGGGSGGIDTGAGFVAGNSYLTSRTNGLLVPDEGINSLDAYRDRDGGVYIGRTATLRLYPTGSAFENEIWALSLLVPEAEWNANPHQNNSLLYGAVIALLIASLLAAVWISRRYIRPLVSALEMIQSDSPTAAPKTQIAEIDDLLKYLAAQDEVRKALDEEKNSLAAELDRARRQTVEGNSRSDSESFGRFLRNLKTLTTTEEAVLGLYLKELSAQQIADELFVSINTVRFHNRNIYAKLGVSGLSELKVYLKMMREADAHDK
jgi:DNA-binding CsgD family transcriptional regulator